MSEPKIFYYQSLWDNETVYSFLDELKETSEMDIFNPNPLVNKFGMTLSQAEYYLTRWRQFNSFVATMEVGNA